MCWVNQHQCRSRQMWKIFTNSPSTLTFCLLQKWLVLLNNLFMVSFKLIRMLFYAKNKLQMCWVTQHQCRRRQMLKIFTNSPSRTHFLSVTQNDYNIDVEWLNTSVVCSLHKRNLHPRLVNRVWKIFHITQSAFLLKALIIECSMTCHESTMSSLGDLWKFSTFGDVYIDVEWLNTSVVCSLHKRASMSLKLPWINCLGKTVKQTKSECTGWICEYFPHLATSTLMLIDSTHLLFFLA